MLGSVLPHKVTIKYQAVKWHQGLGALLWVLGLNPSKFSKKS